MAQSIKLGNNTYLDESGVMVNPSSASYRGTLADRLGILHLGQFSMSNMVLSSIGSKIAEYKRIARLTGAIFNPVSGATSGYFSLSHVYGIWCFWSANYGWAVLFSDHPNSMVTGTYAAGTWTWRHPTMTTVS